MQYKHNRTANKNQQLSNAVQTNSTAHNNNNKTKHSKNYTEVSGEKLSPDTAHLPKL